MTHCAWQITLIIAILFYLYPSDRQRAEKPVFMMHIFLFQISFVKVDLTIIIIMVFVLVVVNFIQQEVELTLPFDGEK